MKISNEWTSKLYLLRDAILKNRTDGALVRLTTPILPGERESDADKRLQEFMRTVIPSFAGYLPPNDLTQIRPAMSRPNATHS
jgi:hypothetical protein